MPRRYLELDVFADRPLHGNPLAVIVEAQDLGTAQMQRIATWTNCAETIFLLPPTQAGADYRVRIFTVHQELPFAGHPSLGAAFGARHAGLLGHAGPDLVQECGAGLLPVHLDEAGAIHVRVPDATLEPLPDAAQAALAEALGTAPTAPPWSVCNGPRWIVAELAEAAAVRRLRPDLAALGRLAATAGALGAAVFGREPDGPAAMAVRAFCPGDAVPEDPVTGSANAAIASVLHATGGLERYGGRHYVASQGREVGRDGRVAVHVGREGAVTVGGRCALTVEGVIHLDV
ncbi:PhzF family phenazine biosynthesis protein [Frateuria defendens]|uniref:PhzF family phenazine biosynthesis protein n=1 Tax=Frateuria defendens TaxID=2219559 RepID=UPI00066FC05E|nr:PhzF family phenazine biosynthesis protein [Frateuria defendens]